MCELRKDVVIFPGRDAQSVRFGKWRERESERDPGLISRDAKERRGKRTEGRTARKEVSSRRAVVV